MVQEESLNSLYEEFHKRFKYRDGTLVFRYNIHSKQREGESPRTVNNCGYLKVSVNGKGYLVHRIIFLMHHGYLPDMIDHIVRDKLNNRIENLRPADKKLNSWNKELQSNNTSGYRGVSWNKGAGKWHSYIKIDGKRYHLGLYDTPEEASEAYEKSRINFGADEVST